MADITDEIHAILDKHEADVDVFPTSTGEHVNFPKRGVFDDLLGFLLAHPVGDNVALEFRPIVDAGRYLNERGGWDGDDKNARDKFGDSVGSYYRDRKYPTVYPPPKWTATFTDELGTHPAPGPSEPSDELRAEGEVVDPPYVSVTDKVKLGRSIIQRRSEILEQAPAVQEAARTILANYEQNIPNDPKTQAFVSNLQELTNGIDGFVAILKASPTEELAADASLTLFDKIIAAIEALEKTKTGERFSRLAIAAMLIGVVALAAPIVSPYVSLPILSACVFPEEAGKAVKLLKGVGTLIDRILPQR